ncbi:MAG: helix-turn-helix transcriptional regulator [Clostridia bacterium]|nr:helix-turn-helix transcriptional regulator [Clostridia bacterium]
MAAGRDGRITTSQLLTRINSAKSFEEAISWHKTAQQPSFSALLYEMMDQKKLTAKELIALTEIDRSYFYHILSGEKHPGRNMVLRIALCMKLTATDCNRLLRLAGTSELYPRIRRDAIIIYALHNKCGMAACNELLLQQGEQPLYRENSND